MDRLFCPWRYAYVTSIKPSDPGCILCDLAGGETTRDEEELVLSRTDHHFVVLNRYPYNTAHLMIVPNTHTSRLTDLPLPALHEMWELAARAEAVVQEVYRPDGLNMGLNLGRYAGAGIADHLHLHVVPRWPGDTSFISVTGETRVLPETLEQTWTKLRERF